MIAGAGHAGMRFDRVLEELLPRSGLRLRRRLIENGSVLVDGKKRKPGFKIYAGAEVVLSRLENSECVGKTASAIQVVERGEGFAALDKPHGLHSAGIAGSTGVSVEEFLPEIFPEEDALLANRLDLLTSGLLLVAFGTGRLQEFHEYEDAGKVEKEYLARVHGQPHDPFTVKNRLDTADRKQTGVLDEPDGPLRWTVVEPLRKFDDGTSLVRVNIAKGARHQIRAHLAHAGFPIVGDPLYGIGNETGRMYLHHFRIAFTGFEAVSEPDW